MATTAAVQASSSTLINKIVEGDCIEVMQQLTANSVDFLLTDPPYLVNYRDRSRRSIHNDSNPEWLKPAMAGIYRLLKNDRLMLCFYGWSRVHHFMNAWMDAGFRPVGHIVFVKCYPSKTRFVRYQHEQAYLLAKGNPSVPEHAISDVQSFEYTGNKLHPTQKPISALSTIIRAFTQPGELVLDPFCGSASTCAAALLMGRRFLGIELDPEYFHLASARMERIKGRIAARRGPGISAGVEWRPYETRKRFTKCERSA